MANKQPKFAFTNKQVPSEELTEENFKGLSQAYQILANLAVEAGVDVKIADYNGNKYIHRDTLQALMEKLWS